MSAKGSASKKKGRNTEESVRSRELLGEAGDNYRARSCKLGRLGKGFCSLSQRQLAGD